MIASAPAKVILFGEHAVVYGEPAIAVAINLRTYVEMEESDRFTVNGYPMNNRYHSYIKNAIEMCWDGKPLRIRTRGDVPSASGMGSSASITVATLTAILAMKNQINEEKIAKMGFEVEYKTQGRASPIDTSTVTHGNGILVHREIMKNHLWSVEKNGVKWHIHHVEIPSLKLVVGFSGIKGSTSEMVEKVRRFYNWNSFARDVVREIGDITIRAIKPLEEGDYETIGALMNRDNQLLTILGVSHPMLKRMINAAMKNSYGAKLTGAGGGGSIIALTDEQDEVARAIEDVGGKAYKVSISKEGFRVENHF